MCNVMDYEVKKHIPDSETAWHALKTADSNAKYM